MHSMSVLITRSMLAWHITVAGEAQRRIWNVEVSVAWDTNIMPLGQGIPSGNLWTSKVGHKEDKSTSSEMHTLSVVQPEHDEGHRESSQVFQMDLFSVMENAFEFFWEDGSKHWGQLLTGGKRLRSISSFMTWKKEEPHSCCPYPSIQPSILHVPCRTRRTSSVCTYQNAQDAANQGSYLREQQKSPSELIGSCCCRSAFLCVSSCQPPSTWTLAKPWSKEMSRVGWQDSLLH